MTAFKIPDWVHEYLQLAAEVAQIAYSLIFSERLSRRLNELHALNYSDPNRDYDDDVKAYAWALREQAEEIKKAYRSRE